jgi:RNA polymerase sigma factor (sigma-70 family)
MPSSDNKLNEAIIQYANGRDHAGDVIYLALKPHIQKSVAQYFSASDLETDDLLQDTILSVLNYIRKKQGFDGDLISFAITIARNRCRNVANTRNRRPETQVDEMADWLASTGEGQLDAMMGHEAKNAVQKALKKLGKLCEKVIKGFYLDNTPVEELRQNIGLKTVQGVYHRKQVCLDEMMTYLTHLK